MNVYAKTPCTVRLRIEYHLLAVITSFRSNFSTDASCIFTTCSRISFELQWSYFSIRVGLPSGFVNLKLQGGWYSCCLRIQRNSEYVLILIYECIDRCLEDIVPEDLRSQFPTELEATVISHGVTSCSLGFTYSSSGSGVSNSSL